MKNENDGKKKETKKKGPVRTEAIIPTAIVFALLAAYYVLFFDIHLKKGLELIGSYAYGAEIDIDDLSTSIKEARFELTNIQLTDIDQPERNLLQIGQIRLQMNWDALLRAKFVVTDSGIESIRLHTERDRAGKIYRSKEETEGQLEGVRKKALQGTKETFADNIFGDAASLLEGTDPADQLKVIENELATKQKIDQIQNQLDQKEAEWKQKIGSLPDKEKLKQLERRLKALKFNSKNPQEVVEAIQQANHLIKEAERDIKSIETAGTNLKNDVNGLESQIKELDETRKKDIAALQNRIKIPELDTKTIAMILFGDQIREYQNKFGRYIAMGREYIPTDKKEAETKTGRKITPKERALGKTYEFPTTKSYPLFWLQKGSISSQAENTSLGGNLSGKIVHLTSNQKLVGKPTEVELAGDFPHESIFGIKAHITSDHSGEKPVETLKASVESYPTPKKNFSNSDKVKFGFSKALGSIGIDGVLLGGDLQMKINNTFKQIDYFAKAESSTMQEVLQQVAQDVPVITVGANLTGYWREPHISLQTNLATAIASSLRRQLERKIAEAKAKLTAKVDQAVAEAKAKLMQEFNRATAQYRGEVEKLEKQAAAAKQTAQAEIDKAKKSQTKGVEDKAKKEIDKFRKKLGF